MPGAAPLLVGGSSDGSAGGGDFPGPPEGFPGPGRPGFRGDVVVEEVPACVPGDVAPDGARPGSAAAPDDGSAGAAGWDVGAGASLPCGGGGASFCCVPGAAAPELSTGTGAVAVSAVPDPGDIDGDEL